MYYFKILNNNKISPYLFLYKTQFTSFFSILMRVSGFLFFLYYFVILLNLITYFSIFSIYNLFFNNFFFLNSSIAFSNLFFIIFFTFYHFIFGIRYILSTNYWNNQIFLNLLNLKIFYDLAFLLILFIIFLIFIINKFSLIF